MRIRVVQLISNYYKDDEGVSTGSEEDMGRELGEYCCLGHFDAIHVELVKQGADQSEKNIRALVDKTIVKKMNGNYNVRNVVCVTDDDEKDEQFWKEAETSPFMFFSLVSLKEIGGNPRPYALMGQFGKMNAMGHSVAAYYTYDHSEIVVFRTGQSYVQSFRETLSLYDEMEIFKMYTVAAVRESALGDCENIHDEEVGCRLCATVKNKKEIDQFKENLAAELGKDISEIKIYETLGNSDILIEISGISMKKMLGCYKMGRLLTHTNRSYKKAFFNIESQLLVEGKENGYMGDR